MFTQPQWLSAVLCVEVIAPPSLVPLYTPVSSVPVRIRNVAGQDIIADDIFVNITTDKMKARLHGVVNV